MIVLDASAVIELLLVTPTGVRVGHRISPPRESLHAPHLLDVEVAQVLRRYLFTGALTQRRSEEALQDLMDMDVARYSHVELLPRVWHLRRNVTAYDALYLALAEALDTPLLTCDRRLARSTGHRARVELV